MKPERLMTTSDLHVYTGQTLSVLTNGYYRPLLHRAVLRPDRLSMPFFLRCRPSARLIPLQCPAWGPPSQHDSSEGDEPDEKEVDATLLSIAFDENVAMTCHELYTQIKFNRNLTAIPWKAVRWMAQNLFESNLLSGHDLK